MVVAFLVRRERKLDVKADVAIRRLERLEQENLQMEDEALEASLPESLADKTKVVELVVGKFFVDKGFGFGKVPTGEVVFIHASVVRGAEDLTIIKKSKNKRKIKKKKPKKAKNQQKWEKSKIPKKSKEKNQKMNVTARVGRKSRKPDPRRLWQMGAKGQHFKERLEGANEELRRIF